MNPVLICLRGRIVETGILSVLNAADDLRAIRVRDSGTIKGDILKMQPCVVILDAAEHEANAAQVLEFLNAAPDLRILLVHLESNVVEVYEKHEITLNEAADLIRIIHRSWPAMSQVDTQPELGLRPRST